MKKPTGLFFVLLSLLVACDSYIQEKGNGNVTTQERAIESFREVEVSGSFEVLLKRAAEPRLTIITDENLHQFIKVEHDGDVLEISSDRNLRSKDGVKLEIGYTDLMAVSSSGAAVITSEDSVTGDYLRLEMSGAGAMDLLLDVKALKVTVSGAGAVELKGKVIEQNIQMSGAGGLDAKDLISENCKVSISGVGGAAVHVTGVLNASVSGVGGITYRGNPTQVKSDISGLGTITREDQDREL